MKKPIISHKCGTQETEVVGAKALDKEYTAITRKGLKMK